MKTPFTPYQLFGDEGILSSGWAPFVEPLVKECQEKGYEITQIKEKYGTLRFYGVFPDDMYRKVGEAERLSAKTCYTCGKSGKTYYMGWCQTLCPEHAIENYGKEEVEVYEATEIARARGHQEDDSA
jgi:hypothetical protein